MVDLKMTSRQFKVRITETLQRDVIVNADSREEAEQAANNNWVNSKYVLIADDFSGVEFTVLKDDDYPEFKNDRI